MWRRLFKIFGKTVIAIIYYDGEIVFRFANHMTINDEEVMICRSIIKLDVICHDGGKTSGASYVKRWFYV